MGIELREKGRKGGWELTISFKFNPLHKYSYATTRTNKNGK